MTQDDYDWASETSVVSSVVSVSTTAVQLVPDNTNRVALIISGPVTNNLTIDKTPGVTSGAGIYLAAGNRPLQLSMVEYGGLVQSALYAITNTGTETIGVWEVLTFGS